MHHKFHKVINMNVYNEISTITCCRKNCIRGESVREDNEARLECNMCVSMIEDCHP